MPRKQQRHIFQPEKDGFIKHILRNRIPCDGGTTDLASDYPSSQSRSTDLGLNTPACLEIHTLQVRRQNSENESVAAALPHENVSTFSVQALGAVAIAPRSRLYTYERDENTVSNAANDVSENRIGETAESKTTRVDCKKTTQCMSNYHKPSK